MMKKILLLSFLCLTRVCNSQNLLNGLQACYPLDGNATNYAATGSALDGITVNVNSTTGHTGLSNTAYQFNGDTGSYIKLPNDVRIKPNALTFSGWFYIDSLPNEQYLVYTNNNCLYNFEAYSLITVYSPVSNQQVFRVSKSGSTCNYAPQIESMTIPVTGVWYHVAFCIDNSNILLYVNGSLESSTTHTVAFDYNLSKNVFLGVTHESNYNLPFKGRMDNIRFYDRFLSAQEVSLLYADQSSCSGPRPMAAFTKPDKQICINQPVPFTDQSTNTPSSWNWQFSGGSPATSTLTNPVCTFSAAGVYSVSLLVGNSSGSSTAVQTVTVSACTAINEVALGDSKITTYPNPSTGVFFAEHAPNTLVNISDKLGNEIEYNRSAISATRSEISIVNREPGVYFIRLYNADNDQVHCSKIVIIK